MTVDPWRHRLTDAGDEEQVLEEEDKAKIWRERELEEMRRVLDTEEGRAVVWRLLSYCRLFSMSYAGDVYETHVNEGMRRVGLRLMDEVLTSAPEAYMLMSREASDREEVQFG